MKRKILSLALCCLLLLSLPITCLAAELTTAESTRLNQIFNQLELNNNEQQNQLQRVNDLLNNSDKQILILNEQLKISNNQINLLEAQLVKANNSISQAQISLQKANQSLEILQKENKEKIRKATLERDIAIIGVIALLFKK